MIIDTLAFIFGNHTAFFSDRLLVGETIYEEALRWNTFVDGLRAYEILSPWTEEFKEELVWVQADDEEWPFSFLRLCWHFHIDHETLRKNLLESKL